VKQNGFSLIELMVVIAIVGILASVALPAYTDYINRGKITDAVAELSDYRVKMEQYFQDHRNYGTAGAACTPAFASSKYFTFSCTVGDPADSFVATASSIAGSLGAAAGDYTMTINQLNAKATTKFKGASVSKSCWLIRGNEC
jgi:type IV pilus assembly protein PilE